MKYKRGKYYYLRQMVNGKRLHVNLFETDPRKAEQKAERLIRAAREGKPPAPTVAEWWARYEPTYTATKGKDGGQKIDRRAMRYVLEMWGPRPLDTIAPTDCLEWQNKRLAVAAPNTVRTEQAAISAFFKAAVKNKVLGENPWVGIRRPQQTRRTRVLSHEEQRKLLRQLLPHHDTTTQVLLGTGLRMHELIAFRSENVKAEGLHVVGKGRKKRVVPLQQEVRERLADLQAVNHRVFEEALERAAVRAKIPHVTPHDLRRTFATRCAVAGMPALVLARILGHSSIRTTEQYYVHIGESEATAAIERVNLGLGAKAGKILQHRHGPGLHQG